MPKGENSDAPDRVYLDPNRPELGWAATPSRRVPGDVPYVRSTPARAAAEQMLEALRTAKQAMESAILSSGPDEGPRHGFDPNHPAMRQITAAIAEAEPTARE